MTARFDVRARKIHLDRDQPIRDGFQRSGRRRVLVDAPTPDRRDHARAARFERGEVVRDPRVDTRARASPTEFSIPPPGASATRSGGLPSHANAATDFVVTAPRPRGSHSAATSAPCPNVPDAATIGFGQRDAARARRDRRRPDAGRLRRGVAGAPAVRPRAAAGRRGGTPAASAPRARRLTPRRCPAAAASAAATVVTQATPCTIAARRMCMPSARGPRPRGVFTTRSTLPDEMRSTASTPTVLADLRHDRVDRRCPSRLEHRRRCPRSPRSRSRARRSGGPRRGPSSLSRSASERKTVPWLRQRVARAGLALARTPCRTCGRCP